VFDQVLGKSPASALTMRIPQEQCAEEDASQYECGLVTFHLFPLYGIVYTSVAGRVNEYKRGRPNRTPKSTITCG
jgi:hypothetical protein